MTMRRKFYNRFINPLSTDSDQAEREIVLNFLLVGILALSLTSFLVTLFGPLVSGVPSHPNRLLGNFFTSLFIVGLYIIARTRQGSKLVAVLLTLLIALFGFFVALQWGLLNANSLLLFSLAVVMAGILIGARYSLYMTSALVVAMVFLRQGEVRGSIHPDLSWLNSKPAPGDVVGFSAVLFVIALVSWLFNRQMEASLRRARRSEKALKRQRDLLEIKVEKRARELEAAQLEKMQELYRFAELGQLSTALFHDLADHLSTVNVDIEGLEASDRPEITRRIQRNVGEINDIVRRVRQQIGGKDSTEVFNVLSEIKEVIHILAPAAEKQRIRVDMAVDGSVRPSLSYKGDITRFRQVILNLVSNGIEAYPNPTGRSGQSDRPVEVAVRRQGSSLLISVTDYGRGISPHDQAKIFEPFYTTKQRGVGIGLFIVKQVVENDLAGELTLTSSKQQGTVFTISMPKSYYARAKTG